MEVFDLFQLNINITTTSCSGYTPQCSSSSSSPSFSCFVYTKRPARVLKPLLPKSEK